MGEEVANHPVHPQLGIFSIPVTQRTLKALSHQGNRCGGIVGEARDRSAQCRQFPTDIVGFLELTGAQPFLDIVDHVPGFRDLHSACQCPCHSGAQAEAVMGRALRQPLDP